MPVSHLTQSEIKEFLNTHSLSPQKQFGQNFLIDANLLEILVSKGLPHLQSPETTIVEIGIGLGSLTRYFIDLPNPLVCFEIDRAFAEHARNTYLKSRANCTLWEGDARFHLSNVYDTQCFVFGNLPYHLTSEFLTLVCTNFKQLVGGLFIVQKEFADRLLQEVSSFSVFVRAFGKFEQIRLVNRKCFYPVPKVDSSIIFFSPDPPTKRMVQTPEEHRLWDRFLRGIFWGKRKQIRVSLKESPFLREEEKLAQAALMALERLGISPERRPDSLLQEDFLRTFQEILAIYQNP